MPWIAALRSWLNVHAIPQWRLAHRLWSVRLAILWAIVAGLWVALPAFQNLLPPLWFAALCVTISLAICLARLSKQPGLPDV